jgi:lysophospholipase
LSARPIRTSFEQEGCPSRLAKLDRELISPLPDSYSLPRSLNEAEKAHIQTRLNPNRFLTYLASIGVEPSALNLNLNSSSSTNSTPNVGAAWSGGGYRAMVNGGGNLSVAQRLLVSEKASLTRDFLAFLCRSYGLDSRNSEAVDAGTGEIGQLLSYVTGLSGGSWMVGSMMSWSANGNVSMLEVSQKQWNLSSNLVIPDGSLVDRAKYFGDLVAEVGKKKDEGFNGQITDYC